MVTFELLTYIQSELIIITGQTRNTSYLNCIMCILSFTVTLIKVEQ